MPMNPSSSFLYWFTTLVVGCPDLETGETSFQASRGIYCQMSPCSLTAKHSESCNAGGCPFQTGLQPPNHFLEAFSGLLPSASQTQMKVQKATSLSTKLLTAHDTRLWSKLESRDFAAKNKLEKLAVYPPDFPWSQFTFFIQNFMRCLGIYDGLEKHNPLIKRE